MSSESLFIITPGFVKRRALSSGLVVLLKLGLLFSLFLCLLPLVYQLGLLRIYTMDVALVVMLTLGVLLLCLAPDSFAFKWTGMDKLVLTMVVWMTLNQLFSEHRANSFQSLLIWWRALVLFMIIRAFQEKQLLSRSTLLTWWIFFGGFEMAVGFVQLVTSSEFGLVGNYFGQSVEETSFYGLLGLRRISGTTGNPNVYGQWVVLFSLILNCKLMFRQHFDRMRCPALIASLVVQPFLILGTLSRGCVLLWVFANFIIIVLWVFKNNKYFIVKVLLCSICFVTICGGVYAAYRSSRLSSLVALSSRLDWRSNKGDERRIDMLHNAAKALRNTKVQIFGTGLSAFYPYVFDKKILVGYQYSYEEDSPDSIHNVPALIAVECGVPVFGLFVVVCARAWLFSWRVWRRLKGTQHGYLGVYFLAMSTSLPISMMLYNSVLGYQMLPLLTVYLCLLIHLQGETKIGFLPCCANHLSTGVGIR